MLTVYVNEVVDILGAISVASAGRFGLYRFPLRLCLRCAHCAAQRGYCAAVGLACSSGQSPQPCAIFALTGRHLGADSGR